MKKRPPPPNPDASNELEARYRDLELRLIEAAAASFADENSPSTLPTISAETALKLLAQRGGATGRGEHVSAAGDPEALRQSLRERVDAIRRDQPHPTAPPPADPAE